MCRPNTFHEEREEVGIPGLRQGGQQRGMLCGKSEKYILFYVTGPLMPALNEEICLMFPITSSALIFAPMG